MSRTPYAYTFSYDYGDALKVTPTLDAMAAWHKESKSDPVYAWHATIKVHFDDGTEQETNLHDYLEEHVVDRTQVEAEVDAAIAANKTRHEASLAEARAKGIPIHTVTGSCPLFLCDRDRDRTVENELVARRYSWKGEPVPKTSIQSVGFMAVYEKSL